MNTCALDLSKTSCGWAVYMDGAASPNLGHWTLGSAFTSNGGTYAKLHERLFELRQVMKFEAIYFEEPLRPEQLQGHTNIDTLRVLTGLAAHAESFGHALGCRIVMPVNISSWRRFFIGSMPRGTKTKQWKEYCIERCRQYGWRPQNSDEADAAGLLDYSLSLQGIIPPWRADEVLRPALGMASA